MIHIDLDRRWTHGCDTCGDLLGQIGVKKRDIDTGTPNRFSDSLSALGEITLNGGNLYGSTDFDFLRLCVIPRIKEPGRRPFCGENRRFDAVRFQAGGEHFDVLRQGLPGQ